MPIKKTVSDPSSSDSKKKRFLEGKSFENLMLVVVGVIGLWFLYAFMSIFFFAAMFGATNLSIDNPIVEIVEEIFDDGDYYDSYDYDYDSYDYGCGHDYEFGYGSDDHADYGHGSGCDSYDYNYDEDYLGDYCDHEYGDICDHSEGYFGDDSVLESVDLEQIPFDQIVWDEVATFSSAPTRWQMKEDLFDQYRLIGMTEDNLIALLGESDASNEHWDITDTEDSYVFNYWLGKVNGEEMWLNVDLSYGFVTDYYTF